MLRERVSSDYVLYRRAVKASILVCLIDKKLSHYPNKGRHSLEYFLLIRARSVLRQKHWKAFKRQSTLKLDMAHWVAACLFFLVALQWLSVALASHFRYGTMSWAPVDSYSNTVKYWTPVCSVARFAVYLVLST